MAKVAFVTGGNGITGSAIVDYLAKNTNEADWSQIIVTSRSPFQSTTQDPRIRFIALDFTNKPDDLAASMREACKDVTHAYFSSYVHKDDFAELNIANQAMFENFLQSLLLVTTKLQNVTLQTGGKYYNIHLGPRPSPVREEEPREGESHDNFYFPQEDFLVEKQRGQQWTWNVVRPEAIIGYTMTPNGMNSALTYAVYFLICKELGEEARMPTNQLYWNGVETHSDAELLANFTLWVSTNDKCSNEAFNLVNGDHMCPRYNWPRLAQWFDAHATSDQQFHKAAPKEGEVQQELSLAEWAKDKRQVWDRLCDRAGAPEAKATFDYATWKYQDWVFMRTWFPTLSINKARRYGWTGHVDSFESLTKTFAKLRELKQIP